MPTIKGLIEHLQTNYQPDDIVAYSLWTVNDVKDIAEGYNLTEDEIERVLDWINRKEDCEVGINWDVIRFYIDEVLYKREKKDDPSI